MSASEIESPTQFFGFEPGSERKIARWDQIVAYFSRLEQQSDRIKVVDLGPSTEGNPFLLVFISSPENLANLERLKAINAQLSDPREIGRQRDEGRAWGNDAMPKLSGKAVAVAGGAGAGVGLPAAREDHPLRV